MRFISRPKRCIGTCAHSVRVLMMLFVLLLSSPQPVFAGPPMLTGDTGTADVGRFEVNVGVRLEDTETETKYKLPAFQVNYGLTDHAELTFELPLVVLDEEGGHTKGGPGKALFGLKWRFVDDAPWRPALAIAPEIEFETPGSSSAERGLVSEGTAFTLPLRVEKAFGRFSLGAAIGYTWADIGFDEWGFGLIAGYQLLDQLKIMIEINGNAPDDFAGHELVFNAGAKWKWNEWLRLHLSVGRGIHSSTGDEPDLIGYAGVQFIF
jgi:outer membrane receptor protein involved in Fe transport